MATPSRPVVKPKVVKLKPAGVPLPSGTGGAPMKTAQVITKPAVPAKAAASTADPRPADPRGNSRQELPSGTATTRAVGEWLADTPGAIANDARRIQGVADRFDTWLNTPTGHAESKVAAALAPPDISAYRASHGSRQYPPHIQAQLNLAARDAQVLATRGQPSSPRPAPGAVPEPAKPHRPAPGLGDTQGYAAMPGRAVVPTRPAPGAVRTGAFKGGVGGSGTPGAVGEPAKPQDLKKPKDPKKPQGAAGAVAVAGSGSQSGSQSGAASGAAPAATGTAPNQNPQDKGAPFRGPVEPRDVGGVSIAMPSKVNLGNIDQKALGETVTNKITQAGGIAKIKEGTVLTSFRGAAGVPFNIVVRGGKLVAAVSRETGAPGGGAAAGGAPGTVYPPGVGGGVGSAPGTVYPPGVEGGVSSAPSTVYPPGVEGGVGVGDTATPTSTAALDAAAATTTPATPPPSGTSAADFVKDQLRNNPELGMGAANNSAAAALKALYAKTGMGLADENGQIIDPETLLGGDPNKVVDWSKYTLKLAPMGDVTGATVTGKNYLGFQVNPNVAGGDTNLVGTALGNMILKQKQERANMLEQQRASGTTYGGQGQGQSENATTSNALGYTDLVRGTLGGGIADIQQTRANALRDALDKMLQNPEGYGYVAPTGPTAPPTAPTTTPTPSSGNTGTPSGSGGVRPGTFKIMPQGSRGQYTVKGKPDASAKALKNPTPGAVVVGRGGTTWVYRSNGPQGAGWYKIKPKVK